MTLMLIIIMTSVILLSVLINLTMLKTYYTVKEKKTIKESYYQIQKVFQKDTVRKNDVDEIAKTYNYRVLISDGSGTIVYSSEGEKSLMYKSLWNILNENLDKISNQIKKQGYAVMTNTNKSMGTSINLMGYLDGDYTVIISTPMESIQTSARLSGQFTMYVGLILIICGAVAMYLYSRQFTRPIEDMAKAANQMSHLDFDVKVPTGSDDELGRLGASINELSSKLEFTISELKTANNELQKDIEQKVQIDEMRKEFLSHVSHEFMIEEVVNNYLSNARNHVTDGGIIKVSYCRHGNDVRIKVFNTGDHIPQEDIDKLWVKFYKVDKARTREYGGSGIGLSIVEATMKAHGKDYGVANVEGGVEFYFDVESADSESVQC